jgi:hypothetical protein
MYRSDCPAGIALISDDLLSFALFSSVRSLQDNKLDQLRNQKRMLVAFSECRSFTEWRMAALIGVHNGIHEINN